MFPRCSDPLPGHCRSVIVKSVPVFPPLPCSIHITLFLFQQSFPSQDAMPHLGFFILLYEAVTDLTSGHSGVSVLTTFLRVRRDCTRPVLLAPLKGPFQILEMPATAVDKAEHSTS